MAKAVSGPIIQLIRPLVEDQRLRDVSDHLLLQWFTGQRDEAAFCALLRRHGAMVLDVCRGVLGNEANAEDAFQATFLVLARKAASIRKTTSVGSWLHGVAYRLALKARAQSATRQNKEARAPARQISEPDDLTWREVRQVLHEELAGLPERYRAPLVLCYLEGMTQDKAAGQLGLAKSTLKERLERGRALLGARLVRRGLGPGAVLVAAAWPAATASANMPMLLMGSTVKAATTVAASGAATGVVSAEVAALTEGVLRTMSMTKLKTAMAALLLAVAGLGTAVMIARASEEPRAGENPQPPPAVAPAAGNKEPFTGGGLRQQVERETWFVSEVDNVGHTISLQLHPPHPLHPHAVGAHGPGTEPPGIALQVVVAKDAKVAIDGREAGLVDLRRGMQVSLRMDKDRPTVTRIEATRPERTTLKAIDVEKRTITVTAGGRDWTAPVAADATIATDVIGGKVAARLADLKAGMQVSLRLGADADKIAVKAILVNRE